MRNGPRRSRTCYVSGFVDCHSGITTDGAVENQLERVLSSSVFKRAERSSALLRFVVEQTLNGGADRLKEYTLGAEALGRGESFDPRADPVVRAEASRLRGRLERTGNLRSPIEPNRPRPERRHLVARHVRMPELAVGDL